MDRKCGSRIGVYAAFDEATGMVEVCGQKNMRLNDLHSAVQQRAGKRVTYLAHGLRK